MSRVVDSLAAVCYFLVMLVVATVLTAVQLANDLWLNLATIWSD